MKNNLFKLLLACLIISYTGCSDSSSEVEYPVNSVIETRGLKMSFIQNNKAVPITNVSGKQTVKLAKAPFSIKVKNGANYEAISISVSVNISQYDNQTDFSNYFKPGSGLAGSLGTNGWNVQINNDSGEFNSYGNSRTETLGSDRVLKVNSLSYSLEVSRAALLIYLDEVSDFSQDVVNSSNSEVVVITY